MHPQVVRDCICAALYSTCTLYMYGTALTNWPLLVLSVFHLVLSVFQVENVCPLEHLMIIAWFSQY